MCLKVMRDFIKRPLMFMYFFIQNKFFLLYRADKLFMFHL